MFVFKILCAQEDYDFGHFCDVIRSETQLKHNFWILF
jgi:hypothetical protein